MKTYRVEISKNAEIEIGQIYRYIKADSPLNAKRWRDSLLEVGKSLANFPQRCPLAIEDCHFEIEVRQIVHGNYRILFTINEDEVVILHVRHAARTPIAPEDFPTPTDT